MDSGDINHLAGSYKCISGTSVREYIDVAYIGGSHFPIGIFYKADRIEKLCSVVKIAICHYYYYHFVEIIITL